MIKIINRINCMFAGHNYEYNREESIYLPDKREFHDVFTCYKCKRSYTCIN